MSTYLISVLAIIGLSLIGVLGDYFIKLSGNSIKYIVWWQFLLGLIIYSTTAIGWFFVMKHVKLSSLGVIYSSTTIIALALVGFFLFKETINVYEIIGVTMGIGSIFLLSRFA